MSSPPETGQIARTFSVAVFCPAHPNATLEVLAIEEPESQSAVSRAHVRCGHPDCGLGWTYTATCSPMRDLTAQRLGIGGRHNPMAIPRVVGL